MTQRALFETPNLDGLSNDAEAYDAAGRVLALLACYATNKAAAVRQRLRGDLGAAAETEAFLEGVYQLLPEWARW